VKLQVQPSHEDLSAGAFRLKLKELTPSSSTFSDILHLKKKMTFIKKDEVLLQVFFFVFVNFLNLRLTFL